MLTERVRLSGLLMMLAGMKFIFILTYLNLNIVNVGDLGVGLPVLAAYVLSSICVFFILCLRGGLYFHFSFLLFLFLMLWVAVRVTIDIGSLEYLKQISIATTGGMLLFYLLGAFLGMSYVSVVSKGSGLLISGLVLLFFFVSVCLVLSDFSQRMDDQRFYLLDVDGAYQRAGNFLSISYLIFSYVYVHHCIKGIGSANNMVRSIFWLLIYTATTVMCLLSAQLFGSNSATAVSAGVYLISLVMTLIFSQKKVWVGYVERAISFPWSKKLLKKLFSMSMLVACGSSLVLFFLVWLSGFDVTSIRLLGFGEGESSSFISRMEILSETGMDQLGYAPFFGNINVAYHTTGDSSRSLHNFFPHVMANLGFVGLVIVLSLFGVVFHQLYSRAKCLNAEPLSNAMGLYSIFVFLYLIVFANLATGVSWVVLWFALGFISRPFGFKL